MKRYHDKRSYVIFLITRQSRTEHRWLLSPEFLPVIQWLKLQSGITLLKFFCKIGFSVIGKPDCQCADGMCNIVPPPCCIARKPLGTTIQGNIYDLPIDDQPLSRNMAVSWLRISPGMNINRFLNPIPWDFSHRQTQKTYNQMLLSKHAVGAKGKDVIHIYKQSGE